ncbi:MAG TPA: hypothetical protein PKE29_10130 [Phycisphaerales bacterium]|nr:hypothetical protein [Phycisphaerales bacterium]
MAGERASVMGGVGSLDEFLRVFIGDHQFRVVLDLPCGDWRAVPRLDWNEVQYIGLDGDPAIVEANRRRRDTPANCFFHHMDVAASQLPPADAVLIRGRVEACSLPAMTTILEGAGRSAHVLVIGGPCGLDALPALTSRHRATFDVAGVRVSHWSPPAAPTSARPIDWSRVQLTEANAAGYMDLAAALCPDEPTQAFEGRGVVIPAGGPIYLPCAWVCVRMLRHVGCTLPVEMWHLGPEEMPEQVRRLLESLGVRTVDALDVLRDYPVRRLDGWSLKPYAIMHSRFREVLMLDADNVPIVDPTFLFDTPEFRKREAIFWPDYQRLAPHRSIWRVTGVPYRDEPEFESGEIVVDKVRCWKPLAVTMWMNEFGEFFYRHMHGDKETFHMAWRKLRRPYAMTRHPLVSLSKVMCQHDFDGRRVFQHRNFAKFSLAAPNRRIGGFLHEERCFGYLRELAELDGVPWRTAASS